MRVWPLAIVASLVAPASLAAQQVPAELTLADALQIARERNPQYLQAVNTARAQSAQVRAGWGAFLPTLSASLAFTGNDSRTATGEDDFGRAVELPTPVSIRRSSASQSISARMTLFDGLGNLNTARASSATADAARAAQHLAGVQADAETTRRFYDALRTERLIALEERLLTSARDQFLNTQRRFRTAAATQEDLLGAEADVASQELQLDRARGEAAKATLAVREYLGIVEDIAFTVTGELPPAEDPSALAAADVVARGLAGNPQVLELDARAHAAQLQATAARGARWPTVSVGASYGRSVSLGSYDALFELNPQNRGFSFSMSLDVPIFTGFQTSARIGQATVNAMNAEEQLRQGRLNVERLIRAALIDVQNAFRGLELAERAAALSRERLRLARERYAIGGLDFANLQLLIDRAAQEERNLINARFQHASAVVTLEERVGGAVAGR